MFVATAMMTVFVDIMIVCVCVCAVVYYLGTYKPVSFFFFNNLFGNADKNVP